jgi:hypothetical protein
MNDADMDTMIQTIRDETKKYIDPKISKFINKIYLYDIFMLFLILYTMYLVMIVRDLKYDVLELQYLAFNNSLGIPLPFP